jgi:hypothetical protein
MFDHYLWFDNYHRYCFLCIKAKAKQINAKFDVLIVQSSPVSNPSIILINVIDFKLNPINFHFQPDKKQDLWIEMSPLFVSVRCCSLSDAYQRIPYSDSRYPQRISNRPIVHCERGILQRSYQTMLMVVVFVDLWTLNRMCINSIILFNQIVYLNSLSIACLPSNFK